MVRIGGYALKVGTLQCCSKAYSMLHMRFISSRCALLPGWTACETCWNWYESISNCARIMILQHELKLVAHTHSNNNYQASDELAIAQMGMNRVPIFRPFLLEWERTGFVETGRFIMIYYNVSHKPCPNMVLFNAGTLFLSPRMACLNWQPPPSTLRLSP